MSTSHNIDLLRQLINSADRLLITSHISPDPDAYCSAWLLGAVLKLNFPEKKTRVVLEDGATGLDRINLGNIIEQAPVAQAVIDFSPNLIIMLDGNNYERFSRSEGQKIRDYVKKSHAKTIIIDHHEKVNSDKVDLYIHRGSPATAQDIYVLAFDELRLKKPKGYVQAAMLGILGDTGRFLYQNKLHRETFDITSRLIDEGVNIEALTNQMTQYSLSKMSVIAELSHNITLLPQYTYSFISDNFTANWTAKEQIKEGCESFANMFIRNIEGRQWGFLVYPDEASGPGSYSVSFRALNGTVDVSLVAACLGGGGHKPAAGAKLAADSASDAVKKVQAAIAKTYPALVK